MPFSKPSLMYSHSLLISSSSVVYTSGKWIGGFPVGVAASVSIIGAFRFLEQGKSLTPNPHNLYLRRLYRHHNKTFVLIPRTRGSPARDVTHLNLLVWQPNQPTAIRKT